MGSLMDALMSVFGGGPVQAPPVPPEPIPMYRKVTQHGPTVDEAISMLPDELRKQYFLHQLRADPRYMEAGARFNASAQEGQPIVLNPLRLEAEMAEIARTLGHEAQHKVQQARPDFRSMSNAEQEAEGTRTGQLVYNSIIGRRQQQARNRGY